MWVTHPPSPKVLGINKQPADWGDSDSTISSFSEFWVFGFLGFGSSYIAPKPFASAGLSATSNHKVSKMWVNPPNHEVLGRRKQPAA